MKNEKSCSHVGIQPYIHGFCPWCDNELPLNKLSVTAPETSQEKIDDITHLMHREVPWHFAAVPELSRAYCIGAISSERPDVIKEHPHLESARDQYMRAWDLLEKENNQALHDNNAFHRRMRAYITGYGVRREI